MALLTMISGTASLFLGDPGIAQVTRERRLSVRDLGPDPLYGAPESLEKLIGSVPAAVIADIVGTGELRLEEILVPHSRKRSVRGYAVYRAILREIVYNKLEGSAPLLSVGAEVEFTQQVGRGGAEAFLANRIPVAPGDECLLFLWRWTQETPVWGILQWHVQFRKSQRVPGVAEALVAGGRMTFLRPGWLDASVPLDLDEGGVLVPTWEGLVQEVRRLGTQP